MKTMDREYTKSVFRYKHLPEPLQVVSKEFHDLAMYTVSLPKNPERTVALRKLLEAKDAAVRSLVISRDKLG